MANFLPLPDTPKADADSIELERHTKKVKLAFAVRSYDKVKLSCSWCTRSDVPLAVSRRRSGYSERYCCQDCADAGDAHQKILEKRKR